MPRSVQISPIRPRRAPAARAPHPSWRAEGQARGSEQNLSPSEFWDRLGI